MAGAGRSKASSAGSNARRVLLLPPAKMPTFSKKPPSGCWLTPSTVSGSDSPGMVSTRQINVKTAAIIVTAVILAGAGTYVAQERKIDQLHAANRDLIAQKEKLQTDYKNSLGKEDELEKLRVKASALPELRNKIAQLSQQTGEDQQRLDQQTMLPTADLLVA